MPAISGVQVLPEADPENLPPATVFTQKARERFLYGDRSEVSEKEGSRETTAEESAQDDLPPDYKEVSLHPELPDKAVPRKRIISDPFGELFKLIREQGSGELVELKIGGISLKFNTLSVQYSIPLITLMVDSKALGLDMDTNSEVQLKLRGRQYDAKYVVTMPCSGHVNLMFFLVSETSDTQSK